MPTPSTIGITLDGVRLELPQDDHITKVIQRNNNWYERAMLDDIKTRVPYGTALDIGACFGTHSLWFSKICGLRVIAVEPRSDNFEILRNNVKLNQDKNITCIEVAVGSKPGFVTLSQELEGNRGSTKALSSHSGIPVITIDSIRAQEVVLIKIDVEGMELDVLEGAQQTLARDKPLLYIEAPETYDKVLKFLLPFGYHRIGKWNATPTYGFAAT